MTQYVISWMHQKQESAILKAWLEFLPGPAIPVAIIRGGLGFMGIVMHDKLTLWFTLEGERFWTRLDV